MRSIRPYLDDVRLCGRLSVEEEQSVAEAAAGGDAEARSRLAKANLRLVLHAAGDCRRPAGVALADMIQEGNIGLMLACKRFDPKRGVKFSTFAFYAIRRRIQRAAFNAATIRLPAYIQSRLAQWRRAEEHIVCESGRHATDEETSDSLKLSDAQRQTALRALAASRRVLRLCELAEADLIAEATDDPALELDSQLEIQRACDLLDALPEREAGIVRARCGFGRDGQPSTYEEIAAHFGISKEASGRSNAARWRHCAAAWSSPAQTTTRRQQEVKRNDL